MEKATQFWNYLCNDLDYRFFAGVVCKGLDPLYKKMNSEIMHYVPAANECIALSLVTGINMAGIKGGILMNMYFKNDIVTLLKFNIEYKIPLLIIGYGDYKTSKLIYDFPIIKFSENSFKKDLKYITNESESSLVPGIIIIEEGSL